MAFSSRVISSRTGNRFEIDRDLIIEKRQGREPVDDSGIGLLRPTLDREERVVIAIEVKTGLVLRSDAVAVPAKFLNGKLIAEQSSRN